MIINTMDKKPVTTSHNSPPSSLSYDNDKLSGEIKIRRASQLARIFPQSIGIVLLIVVSCGIGYFLGSTKSTRLTEPGSASSDNILSVTPTYYSSVPTSAPSPTIVPTAMTETALFAGQIKQLNRNLKLFNLTRYDILNDTDSMSIYYEAGIFTRGTLKGYTRIIAFRPGGMGIPSVYILATKDFKTYILDDPDNSTTKYPLEDERNLYQMIDKNNIVSTQIFDTELPRQIKLDFNFSLYAANYPTAGGYPLGLLSDYSHLQRLSSNVADLTYYYYPNQNTSPPEDMRDQIRNKYVLGSTEVIVVDSAGLPLSYLLTTSTNIKAYEDLFTDNGQEVDTGNYLRIHTPNIGFASSQINNRANLPFFDNYKTAFLENPCANSFDGTVVDVLDSEFKQIGNIANVPVFKLKNDKHLLYSLAYDIKTYLSDDMYEDNNKGMKKPTLEEYVANNPLLFIKDYWQRWVALGEFDILFGYGCGKPVIYLYPESPTNVSVKFDAPVQFTVDIPKYADSWQVKAYPNGDLVNLKPELTDCNQIDSTKKGMEYAKLACQNNTYPYLYWAGSILSKNYPEISKGWVVAQSDLSSFIQAKLFDMGLNTKETNDFMEYWLPDMLAKNAPYYRIAFLQTSDLNLLFPMTVSPKPDTTFRIFLDYLPLTDKPTILPEPQSLDKLQRVGFTLVEWGGLKQP